MVVTIARGGPLFCERAGTDGELYVLDLGRAFPPEHPEEAHHLLASGQSVFYRQLRPELLLSWKVKGQPALSPDALTLWGGSVDKQHNENVRNATRWLVRDAVPALARALMEKAASTDPMSWNLSSLLHRQGAPVCDGRSCA